MKWGRNSTPREGQIMPCAVKLNLLLERAVDGVPSQIPTLKFLTPSNPKSHPWGIIPSIEWNSAQYVLYPLFVSTHAKFGIKIFEIDMVTEIMWYLTFWPHPRVPCLTIEWKFYLHFVLLVIPSFWYATRPCLKKMTHLGTPAPQSPIPGQGDRINIQSDSCMCCVVFFICTTHTKFGIKIFEIDMLTKILCYFTFWPHPKVISVSLGYKLYLYSVLLVIPVDLINHKTMFEKKVFLTSSASPAPKSPTPGAWPRQ